MPTTARLPGTLALLLLTAPTRAQQLCGDKVDAQWLTTPERTEWKQTSTSRDVRTLLAKLHAAHPKRFELSKIGTSLRGRPIQIASIRRPEDKETGKRLRAVIIANIHGGEIEGKEAVQVLLREIALGGHEDILRACDLWFVPVYNVDGNDDMQAGNRGTQNGPETVGMRRNSQNLDLNRDFVKIESPEARALLRLFRRVDPHFFMDLHTTNGSPHGYHLTYAPSLSTNMDAELAEFMHTGLIPKIRASMLKRHGFRVFDYGNFPRGRGAPTSWTTYGHTPRYAINYFGLRNRLSLLSEAYSYLPFKERALVTRAFVVESLRELVAHREQVLELCAAAERHVLQGGLQFGFASRYREAERREVLVGNVSRDGPRLVAGADHRAVEMDVRVRFESTKFVGYPAAWAIEGASDAVRRALLMHGVGVYRLRAEVEVDGETFHVTGRNRPRGRGMRFEGHRLVTLRGEMAAGKRTLPVGTLIVPARQAAARVAAQLLEAQSEDSLATWNFFDEQLRGANGQTGRYPVVRVMQIPKWQIEPLSMQDGDEVVRAQYSPAPAEVPANAMVVKMLCTKTGRPRGRQAYEGSVRWVGREVKFEFGGATFDDAAGLLGALKKALSQDSGSARPCLLCPDATITNAELLRITEKLSGTGAEPIYLKREPE